jgi:hypothetical protein
MKHASGNVHISLRTELIDYNANASRRSWNAMCAFLTETD